MKFVFLLAVALCAGCSGRGPDYGYLFNHCMRENRQASASQSAVRSYCTCMAESRSADPRRTDSRDHAAWERRSGWVQSSILSD